MTLYGLFEQNASPGRRVRLLAEEMGTCQGRFIHDADNPNENRQLTGVDSVLYKKLSQMMCWDAAIYCAWCAKGITCSDMNHFTSQFNVVGAHNWGRVFGGVHGGRMVDDVHQCMQLPEGCFVGFFRGTSLAHVMLHTKDGWGAGNKNNCVLSDGHPAGVGWELLDMTQFFLKDKNYMHNEQVDMFHTPITGQTI